jgi:hypothetical protein
MDVQSTNKEGQIALALQAYKDGHFTSWRAAADAYDVAESTLWYRVKGGHARKGLQAINTKLSTLEEAALIKWILSMDERGLLVTYSSIQQMANLLL